MDVNQEATPPNEKKSIYDERLYDYANYGVNLAKPAHLLFRMLRMFCALSKAQ
jgi:hypothetical protein